MRILGIDPGLATLGYGVIESKKETARSVQFGTIQTSQGLLMGKRLEQIQRGLLKLIKEFSPAIVCVETLFFFQNQKTIIQIGQVHGIIALTFYKKRVPIVYYPPLKVKNIITGNGRAKKREVQIEIGRILGLAKRPTPDDAADALAVAMCHVLDRKKRL